MLRAARFCFLVALLIVPIAAWPSAQQAPPPPPPPPGMGQAAPPVVGTGFIAGQVIDYPSGKPIPEATVGVSGRGVGPAAGRGFVSSTALITDAQGRFFFANLPPGLYSFQIAKPGFSQPPQSVGQMIELKDAERVADVRLRLGKLGSISGTLRDEAGDPVVGTEVVAFRRAVVNGRQSVQPVARNRSDDRGVFRIGPLPASDYVLCACSRDPIPFDATLLTTLASEPLQLMTVAARAITVGSDAVSLDNTLRTYAPTFHQNSSSLARATRITLGWGDDKTGIDMMVQLVHATRVSGAVVGAPGPVQASFLRLVSEADFEAGATVFSLQPMVVQPDGRFDFTTVPPGQYRLVAVVPDTTGRAGGPSGAAMGFVGSRGATPPPAGATMSAGGPPTTEPPLWANEPISVGETGVTGVVVTLNRAPRIAGRVQWVGAAPQPPAQMLQRASVSMQPMSFSDPMFSLGAFPIGRFSPDASFVVPGAIPGKYMINATPLPGFPTLKSVMVGGLDVTDLPFEVAEKDISEVVITFVDTPLASLTVNVAPAPAGSKSGDDAQFVVFPADRRYWTDPSAARRRYRNGLVPSTNTVTTPELPAGDYFVAIVNGMDVLDFMELTKLEALSRRAQRVTLIDGGKATVEVRR